MGGNGIIVHGTVSGYVRHKCRCDLCRKANREYRNQREYEDRNKITEYAYWFPFEFEWTGDKWVRKDD